MIRPGTVVLAAALALAAGSVTPTGAQTAQLHNTTGLAYFYQGDMQAAYEELVRALDLDPDAIEPHYNLGRVFERLGRYQEALEQFQQALSLDPKHQGSLEGLERMGFYITPPKPVTEGFSDEKTRRESLTRELTELMALNRRSRHQEVLDRVAKARELFGDDPKLDLASVPALEALRRVPEAVELLRRVEKQDPGSWALQFHLAKDLFDLGYFDESLLHARRAVDLDPANARGHLLLAEIHEVRAEPSLAFDRLVEASRLDTENKELAAEVRERSQKLGLIHYTNGLFFFNQKDWKAAKVELERALQSGRLSDDQRAIAQQFLIVSEFSLAEVAQSIRKLQQDRAKEELGFLGKRIGFRELIENSSAFPAGTPVEFEGWIVSTSGQTPEELIVTTDPGDIEGVSSRFGRNRLSTDDIEFNVGIGAVAGSIDRGANARNPSAGAGQPTPGGAVVSPTRTTLAGQDSLVAGRSQPVGLVGFRSNARMDSWFTARTPKPLPKDDRIRPLSRIRVEGQLEEPRYIRNAHNGLFSVRRQPAVKVTFVSIQRETRGPLEDRLLRLPQTDVDTPPGLAGPLRVDFLELSELQRKNQ